MEISLIKAENVINHLILNANFGKEMKKKNSLLQKRLNPF